MKRRLRLLAAAAALAVASLAVAGTGAASVPPLTDYAARGCRAAVAPHRSGAQVLTASPFGIDACPGVRPGALVEIPNSGDGDILCTMGFVFTDALRRNYISTAGHCVLGAGIAGTGGLNIQRTWAPGAGPVALDSDGNKIGNYVFGIERGDYDFGLIQLTVTPNPRVCHFGGPTGVNTSTARSPVKLELYGNAIIAGTFTPARSGETLGMPQKNWVAAMLPSFEGDSGGPVLSSDGRAVGYVVAFGVGYDLQKFVSPHAGWAIVDRLAPNVGIADAALRTRLLLVTAKPA
jgi:hypothetical protein